MEVSSILIILLHERGELQISSGDNGENLLFFIRDFNYHEIEEWDLRAAGSSQWKLMNLPGGPKVVWAALRGITKSFTRYTEGEQLMPSHFLHLSNVVGLSANLPFQSEHEQFRISLWREMYSSSPNKWDSEQWDPDRERESYLGDGVKLPSGYL